MSKLRVSVHLLALALLSGCANHPIGQQCQSYDLENAPYADCRGDRHQIVKPGPAIGTSPAAAVPVPAK
jgi:hypothetical protein